MNTLTVAFLSFFLATQNIGFDQQSKKLLSQKSVTVEQVIQLARIGRTCRPVLRVVWYINLSGELEQLAVLPFNSWSYNQPKIRQSLLKVIDKCDEGVRIARKP